MSSGPSPVLRTPRLPAFQPRAGISDAFVAVLPRTVCALPDPAPGAMRVQPAGILRPAARASVFLPQVADAEPAVYAAGSDQERREMDHSRMLAIRREIPSGFAAEQDESGCEILTCGNVKAG